MSNALRTMAAASVAALILTGVTTAQGSTVSPPPRAHWMRAACPDEESSTDCAWNAAQLGNGVGHSFYSVTRRLIGPHGHDLGRVTCVYYAVHADARRWDACHLLPKGVPTHP